MVKTDHILFIASGAFHLAKPSDLIPELQGRFPIRVELDSLSVDDFERILTGTDACLTQAVPGAARAPRACSSSSRPTAIRRLAEIAFQVNERTENIGARRLHTVLEGCSRRSRSTRASAAPATVTIDAAYVDAAPGRAR